MTHLPKFAGRRDSPENKSAIIRTATTAESAARMRMTDLGKPIISVALAIMYMPTMYPMAGIMAAIISPNEVLA